MEAIAEVIEIAPALEQQQQQQQTEEAAAAPATIAATSEPAAEPKKAPPKAFESLDALLQALNEQDEQLKAMKTTIQDMITTNAALKRGVKQVVQNAEKNDEIEQELQQARKKLTMLKTFING